MRGSVNHLVEIISVVAALTVLLVIVFPAVREALVGTGEKGQCNFSLLVSRLGSQVFQDIPTECKAHRITIDKAMLQAKIPAAEKAIKRYKKNQSDLANQLFTTNNLPEWALNSIVADELVDCSDKVLHGVRDLFTGNTASTKISCVICSRIRFSKDLPLNSMNLNSGFISSLNPWLKINNFKGQSYYQYIGFNKADSPAFVYSPKMDYAVVYWEHAPSTLGKYIGVVQNVPWLREGIGIVTLGIGAVSLLTPVGWTASIIAVAGTATTGFTVGTNIANVALGAETSYGSTNKALILTPYDSSLITPYDKGGIGCEQIID